MLAIWKREVQNYFLTPIGYVFMGIFLQKSYGFHATHIGQHCLRSKFVLGDLVLHIAKSGLPDGKLRQFQGSGRKGLRHRFHNGIELLLGHLRQLFLGELCLPA